MLAPPLQLGAVTELPSGKRTAPDALAAEAAHRANHLRSRNVGVKSRVVIVHGQTASFFADLLACFRVGATACVLDPKLTASELSNLVQFLEPELLLAAPDFSNAVDAPILICESERSDVTPSRVDDYGARLDDPALVLFTSGTTGDPKGVVHSYRSLQARIALNRTVIGDASLARTLCMLPTHFGHGLIGNSLTALLSGHELFVGRFSQELVDDLPQLLSREDIRFMSSVPTMWRMILERCDQPGALPLERVQIGSAPLSKELWSDVAKWTGCKDVVNTYGITETANWIGGASSLELEPADGLIGRAWGGTLGVRDSGGAIHAEGSGELVVSSPSLMNGYLEREDLTDEVLCGGWFRTGDLGWIDERGVAVLSGRLKNEINRGGAKIQPEDVDLVVERYDSVAESCTFGIPDELRGERVAAAVRTVPGASLDLDSLTAWCREHLRPHAVPEEWFVVDEIPKTDRGKVQRDRVRKFCLAMSDPGQVS